MSNSAGYIKMRIPLALTRQWHLPWKKNINDYDTIKLLPAWKLLIEGTPDEPKASGEEKPKRYNKKKKSKAYVFGNAITLCADVSLPSVAIKGKLYQKVSTTYKWKYLP